MRTRWNRLAVCAVLTCVTLAAWYAWAAPRRADVYEIQPNITVPYTYGPTADYRLADLVEELVAQNDQMAEQLKLISEKIDSVDAKLVGLTRRIARIERALGIEQPPPVVARPRDPNQPLVLKQQ